MKLFDGYVKKFYAVQEMNLPVKIEKRLEALGMIDGTKLSVLNKKKSALVISVRGTRFALGKSIAENIEVKEL